MPRRDAKSERPEDLLIYVRICIETAQAIGFGPQADLPSFRDDLVLEAVKRVRALLKRPIQPSQEGELILVKREFVRVLADSRSGRISKAYTRTPEGYQAAMRRRIVTGIGKIGATPEERRVILDPSHWNLQQFVEAEPYPGAEVALACIGNRLELQEEAFVGAGVTVQHLCLTLHLPKTA